MLQRRLQGKPPCSDLFGVKGRRWLAGLELPLEERESVDAGVCHIDSLDCEIAAVERLIAQQALKWPEIRRLMTVPGVNLICAATFIAAVDDPRRFLSSRKLVAYLGLRSPARPSPRQGCLRSAATHAAHRAPGIASALTLTPWADEPGGAGGGRRHLHGGTDSHVRALRQGHRDRSHNGTHGQADEVVDDSLASRPRYRYRVISILAWAAWRVPTG